ncbi:TRAM domain-containing protein [Nonomuraea ferruginea]
MEQASLELTVGPVAHGGWCVARHEGRVVFVRHALPGERVVAEVTEETSRFLRADAVRVIEASPDRVVPPCPYSQPRPVRRLRLAARHPGGAAPAQGRRGGRATAPPRRHRARGRRRGGARRQGRARLAHPRPVRRPFRRPARPAQAPLPRDPADRRLPDRPPRGGGRRRRVARLAGRPRGRGDRLVRRRPGRRRHPAPPPPRRRARPRRARRRPARRGQGPHRRAARFRRAARAGGRARVPGRGQRFLAGPPGRRRDPPRRRPRLRRPRAGGVGARPLLRRRACSRPSLAEAVGPEGAVFGLESEAAAVRDARANLRDLPQARIERGRVEDALDRYQIERADLVVVDPPRAGLGRDVVSRVAALEPSRVVYVSCDPATLARDLAWLAERGYPLADLRAFDAFPMTHHVECVALLVRAGQP